MEVVLLILLDIVAVFLTFWNIRLGAINAISYKHIGMQGVSVILLFIVSFIAGVISGDIDKERNPTTPTAMDVYKGETSLRITYQDSIPVDSCVVFKDFE